MTVKVLVLDDTGNAVFTAEIKNVEESKLYSPKMTTPGLLPVAKFLNAVATGNA